MSTNIKKNTRLGFGIRSRLVFGLTLFVIIVLIIVWIFQVLLLDYFYEQTKLSELNSVQKGIDAGIFSGDLDKVCGDLASEYNVCIAVYSISENSIKDVVISKEVSPACIIHYAEKSYLESLYEQALSSGGVFTQTFNLDPREYENKEVNDPYKKDFDEDNSPPKRPEGSKNRYQKSDKDFVVAVSVKAFEDGIGNKYVAFINLQFTPVNTIQNTRNTQFAYIAAFVIASAVIFALLFSSRIAKPLEKMTESASKMAAGDYSTQFVVEGYRESKRLANTLNFAVGEISKTDMLQRELIANVSHDLRTPLSLISGYAEMMRDIPGENTPENSQLIVDETKRLTSLVNDILDFSKYSACVEEPFLRKFDLTQSVREVIARYSELVKVHGYNIQFVSDKNIYVLADERMILQVLYNLINNAINYTGDDKVVKIVQDLLPNGKVKISISDSGTGIPKEDLEHIWDRYYKVDKKHTRAVAGSGLGLSIVSKLLQIHSAEYGVETSASNGTTFWFSLKFLP